MLEEKDRKQIGGSITDAKSPMDHLRMMRILNELAEEYPFLSVTYLGESILGRGIPMVTLGEGEKTMLYVGAHHGMEWITSWVLLRMIADYCAAYRGGDKIDGCDVRFLFETRAVCVVPMLNPDGVEYQIHGVSEDHVLYDRLLSMNGGSRDFSRWQANARGVDLNHNYQSGFTEYKRVEAEQEIWGGAPTRYSGECPESEPETGALCNYIRYREDLRAVITLHAQGEEIYYTSQGETLPASERMARELSRACGYRLAEPEGAASYGGLTDWCIRDMRIPSFTVECGKGSNPLPLTDFFMIYARLRPMLFSAPYLI